MIRFDPNLQVERMVVSARGGIAYDERFHSGLNIIRGENSSGKSSLMDLSDWRETALKCETVYLGVSLNGKSATFARDISETSSMGMRVYFGAIDEAMANVAQGWEMYPYSRGYKDSFSQVIFRLLGLPEVQIEASDSKITMNQILRLLYADQLSPVDKIFRAQTWDDAITRQTVGEFLCGAFSSAFYEARLRLVLANSEYKEAETRIRTLQNTYADDGHPLTQSWLDAQKLSMNKELETVNADIANIESTIFDTQFDDRLSLNDQEETYKNLVKRQVELGELSKQIDQLTLEIADSDFFIVALDKKLLELRQSDSVIDGFKTIEFEKCPACLAPLLLDQTDGICTLCKTPHSHDLVRDRSLKFINEFTRQKEESLDLQRQRNDQLTELRQRFVQVKSLWEQAGRHYSVSIKTPTTEMRSKLRDLNRVAGRLIRQLEELSSKDAIIARLATFFTAKEDLNNEINKLKSIIFVEQKRSLDRMSKSRETISEIMIAFLKRDLERQSTFSQAQEVDFEFDANSVSVNKDRYFSASSMVYLKNSFLAAFLFAAANDPKFAHPRILLMDTIEDKGMEVERSQNFQRILAHYSSIAKSEHQIIIATSMIAPELNVEQYTVGPFYTHEKRTLKVAISEQK
jgi:hypothetical protein